MVAHRSTKGASKARRDHINHEIRNLRALLPISRDQQERMSYLHSMAAICTFIRKSVLLPGLPAADGFLRPPPPYESFLPALHGFILVTTAQGKLVYVSENVSEYLGFSMLDVLQGDSLYDMLERSDVDAVKSNLDSEKDSSSERSFVCRMQTSKAFKLQHGGCCSLLVRGRYLPSSSSSSSSSSQPLFVSLCTPTVDRLQTSDSLSFLSVHRLDMSFSQVSHSVSYFWGYSAEELIGRSWYGLIHPEDLSQCAAAHRSLVQADEGSQVEVVLRLQCKDLSWTWIYIQANKLCELQGVSCTNFSLSETEARFLQTRISSGAFKPSPSRGLRAQQTPQTPSGSVGKCLKRRRASESEEQGGRARRDSAASSPAPSGDALALFTPPYSPASSSSSSSSSSCSPLQEELSRDLLMDVQGYTDQLLSCHLPPSEPTSFIPSPLSSSSSSPSFDFQTPPSDVRLVPDLLSLSDLCESSADCALHHDEPLGGVLLHQHHVLPLHPGLLTPIQSPSSRESDYSEQEQAEISILAQQISSLASSFSSYQSALRPSHASACEWTLPPPPPPPPLKREQVLDDGVFESILKDLDMVSVKGYRSRSEAQQLQEELLSASSGLQGALLPAEAFVDPFGLQLGRSDQNTELHQLNEYMQRVFQQDALAEENLY